jgi:hypothetical protein
MLLLRVERNQLFRPVQYVPGTDATARRYYLDRMAADRILVVKRDVVQANIEDTSLGVQEYAIAKLGVECVEVKWGQGATDIGEVKANSLSCRTPPAPS